MASLSFARLLLPWVVLILLGTVHLCLGQLKIKNCSKKHASMLRKAASFVKSIEGEILEVSGVLYICGLRRRRNVDRARLTIMYV